MGICIYEVPVRTVTGSNISLIRQDTGLDPVTSSPWEVKKRLLGNVASAPDTDEWRLSYLAKLLTDRGEASYREEDSAVLRLNGLIDSLCINYTLSFLLMGGGVPPHYDTSASIISRIL